MKRRKIIFYIVLLFVFIIGCIGNINIKAENKLNAPVIKAKAVKNGTAIKLVVSKISKADGFIIYYKNSDNMYAGYRYGIDQLVSLQDIETKGENKHTVMIKTLPGGKYTLLVKSYVKVDGEKASAVYSEFSKEVVVKIKDASKKGYLKSYDFTKVKVGDIVKFGAYEQDNVISNGREPIEWIVIKKTDKTALLMSKYVLDALPYNLVYEDVNWSNCTLRKWLNNVFYNLAFNQQEKELIEEIQQKYEKHKTTKDNVFLLSEKEVKKTKYFVNGNGDENRLCAPSKYALVHWNPTFVYEGTQWSCAWWLRSDGISWIKRELLIHKMGASSYTYDWVNYAAFVNRFGNVDGDGYRVDHSYYVRPAMYVKF